MFHPFGILKCISTCGLSFVTTTFTEDFFTPHLSQVTEAGKSTPTP